MLITKDLIHVLVFLMIKCAECITKTNLIFRFAWFIRSFHVFYQSSLKKKFLNWNDHFFSVSHCFSVYAPCINKKKIAFWYFWHLDFSLSYFVDIQYYIKSSMYACSFWEKYMMLVDIFSAVLSYLKNLWSLILNFFL